MSDLKLPKHISGCGQYGKGFLAGMEYQENERLKKWQEIEDILQKDGSVTFEYFIRGDGDESYFSEGFISKIDGDYYNVSDSCMKLFDSMAFDNET